MELDIGVPYKQSNKLSLASADKGSVEKAWQIADEIEKAIGSGDAGTGFGYRDLQIDVPENEVKRAVKKVLKIFAKHGIKNVAVNSSFHDNRAYINWDSTGACEAEEKAMDSQLKYIDKHFGKKVSTNIGWAIDSGDNYVQISSKVYRHGIVHTLTTRDKKTGKWSKPKHTFESR